MGNRANYVIIEQGQTQIFYSRWGALTIPSVLISGPEKTLEYIRALEPDEWLLNDTWAEGNILVNVDTHHLLFWGGDLIAAHPYLRRPLLKLLPLLWPGWSIEWAMFGVVDIVRAIGWDISRVLDNDFIPPAFLKGNEAIITEPELVRRLQAKASETLLSVHKKAEGVKDYLIDDGTLQKDYHLDTLYRVLSYGPRLLDLLPAETLSTLPREGSKQEPHRGAYIDEETHTLWIWENQTLDVPNVEAIVRRWPGWQVRGHVEGLYRHVILSNRDPELVKISDQQAAQELITILEEAQGFNPMQLSRAIQQELPAEKQEGIKFGKGFFSADEPPLAPQERREILEGLFSKLLERDEQQSRPGDNTKKH